MNDSNSDPSTPRPDRQRFNDITRREALRRVGFVLGGAVSASTVSALLSGCRGRTAADPAYAFGALSPLQQDLTATLVDLIIPATDTPGALAAGAHEFIDKLLTNWMPTEERDHFLAGLTDVDARSNETHGVNFVNLDQPQQVAILTTLDEEAYAEGPDSNANASAGRSAPADSAAAESAEADPPPPPFFRSLKELTLAGYYTSEIGATQELRWLAAPGRYDGDVPFSDLGRAWA